MKPPGPATSLCFVVASEQSARANDVSAFLITGPEGHIVLDGGYPSTAPMIMASIAKLGFDIRDVKVLLSSEPLRSLPVDIWVTCHAIPQVRRQRHGEGPGGPH